MLTFTIVTVTYNAASTLERTLRSVLGQCYPGLEYIIVDGGSTDGTLSLVGRYLGSGSDGLSHCISTFVSEPDRGLYDAMNKGMALATGDYVCFLNAGDRLHGVDTLRRVADSIAGCAGSLPDVVYGHTAIVDDAGRLLRMRRLVPPERLTWRSFRRGMLVCHQAFWVRRALCLPYDLRYRYSADFDWCIRVMRRSRVLHHTHLTLVDYLGTGGVTVRHHFASLLERFRIMARHYGWAVAIAQHLWFVVRAVVKC